MKLSTIYQPNQSFPSREFMASFSTPWGLESSNLGWSAHRATKWRHGTTEFRQKDPGAEVCRKFEGRKSQLCTYKFHMLIHPIPASLWSNQRFVTHHETEIVQVMGWQCTGDQAKFCITSALLVVYLILLVGFPEVFQTEYQFLWKLHTGWHKVSLSLSLCQMRVSVARECNGTGRDAVSAGLLQCWIHFWGKLLCVVNVRHVWDDPLHKYQYIQVLC